VHEYRGYKTKIALTFYRGKKTKYHFEKRKIETIIEKIKSKPQK
jgi:hypothetical protein